MPPLKDGIYRFDPKSITTIRSQLQITQAKLAAELEVPPNTVSRWERGETAPDARALAAIHSIAMERGLTPAYFKKESPADSAARTELLVNLDFQNLGLTANDVPAFDAWIRDELNRRFPHTANRWFKGFCALHQSAAAEELERMGWRIWEDSDDLDSEIVSQSRSDCGRKPANTILILGSRDGDFAGLITEMRGKGVMVYLTAPAGISQRLAQAVGEDWLIPWPSTGFGNRLQNPASSPYTAPAMPTSFPYTGIGMGLGFGEPELAGFSYAPPPMPNAWQTTPPPKANAKSRLVVMLDFPNSGVSAANVPGFDKWVREAAEKVAPAPMAKANKLFRAFVRSDQRAAAEELRRLKWKITEKNTGSAQAIIQQAKSACGQDPDNTAFVLISQNGDFADLIVTLRQKGVSVYGAGPIWNTHQRLIQAVGGYGRWLQMPLTWPAAPVRVGVAASFDSPFGRPDLRQ